MRTHKCSHYWMVILVTTFTVFMSLSASAGNRDFSEHKISPAETARWWQWGFSLPLSIHPLNLALTPQEQKDYCMAGQRGKTVYLGGAFVADPADFQTRIIRECVIPLGHKILIPTINAECSTAEDNADPNDSYNKKSRDLRNCAKDLAKPITNNIVCFGPQLNPEMVFLGNDKRCPHQLKKVKVHRVNTKSPFVVSFPPDNVLQGSIGDPPAINPSLSQADGYFAKLEPKKPGTYTLATFGEVVIDKESVFALEVIYTIEVVAAQ